MNVVFVILIILAVVGTVAFLGRRRCKHSWSNIDSYDNNKCRMCVQRCDRCGTVRTKKLKNG